jgi:hypothetical protein
VKLVDLHPVFYSHGGEGITGKDGKPVPRRDGMGIIFDCPCGKCDEDHQLAVPFSNPIDGGPAIERGWKRTGETFETLTLEPSILRLSGCGWHGWIRNGEVITC